LNIILYLLFNYLDLFELEFIWTLFKIYDSDVFYFIWIYNFVNTRG